MCAVHTSRLETSAGALRQSKKGWLAPLRLSWDCCYTYFSRGPRILLQRGDVMATKPRASKHIGKNQTSIKAENTSSILRTVHGTNDISRADLVRLTGLTAPTVSRIVSFLVERGVVTESPGASVGVGRKPVVLHFNGRSRYIVAIDFSWAQVRTALMDLGGGILDLSLIHISEPTRLGMIS